MSFRNKLSLLRKEGLRKSDCVLIVRTATDLDLNEAERLVHRSPYGQTSVSDEAIEDMFWRALSILCMAGEGQVNGSAEEAAECHERQQRARTQLHDAAAALPDEALRCYRELMSKKLLGQAFAALVTEGQKFGAGNQYWRVLATVAETLCLNELIGDNGPETDDYVHATYKVRRLAGLSG